MLDKAFEIAVVFSAVDRLTGPAQRMATELGILDEQTQAVQQRLNGFKNMAFVGGAITAVGGVMAAGLLKAVDSAGQLEMSIMGVKDALKLTNSEYQKAMNLSQTAGLPTKFSATDVAGIMQSMATSGLTKNQVLDPKILQEYVNFADVQAQIKHENAPDAVASAVKMAHQYQLYSTAQLTPFLNDLNGALLHTHETADQFATTFKYVANQAKSQGVSSTDTLSITAWLDRMGLGNGRGGTNFADFLQRSIYHSSGDKADAAMEAAGFVKNGHSVFEDAKGNFVGIPAAVQIMQDFSKRFHGNANLMDPLLKNIFGTQGMRVAQLMTSSGATDQYLAVQKQITGTSSIDQSQKDLNDTWIGKMQQLTSTLHDIWTQFGLGVKSALLPLLTGLDDVLYKFLLFIQAHPQMVKWIATFASIAAAVMLVVGPVILLTGVLGYLSEAQLISKGFTMMGSAIGGALGPIALLVSAGYLLYQAWQTDFGGIREKTAAAFEWIKKETPLAVAEIQKLAKALGLEDAKGNFKMPEWLKILMGGMVGGKALGFLGGGAMKLLGPVGKFLTGGIPLKALSDLTGGLMKLMTGETLGFGGNGIFRGGLKKLGSMGLKGLEKGAKALFGKNTVDFAKWFGKGSFNIAKLIGGKGFNLAKLIGGKGFNLAKLIGGKGFDLAKFLGKGSLKGISSIVKAMKPVGGILVNAGKTALSFGGNLLKLGAQALISAARIAAAWVIGLGPVGWIIAGVIAVLALLWLAWKNNWGHIQQHVAATVEFIKEHWQQILQFLGPAGWIIIGIIKLVQLIKQHWGEIVSFFVNMPSEFKQFGENIVKGLWNGISGLGNWLKNKVLGWVKDVLPGPVAKALGIHSPSKLMQDYGKYTAQGLAIGITDNANMVQKAAGVLSNSAIPNLGKNGIGLQNGSGGEAGIYIAEGAIVINAAPGQSPDEIADAVIRKLGRKTRNKLNARPTKVVPQW